MKVNQYKINNKIIFLLIFLSLICQSPIFLNFGIFKGNIYFIIVSLYLIYLLRKRNKQTRLVILPFIFIIILYILGVLYWLQLKLLIFPIYFILAWYIIISLDIVYIEKYIQIANKLVLCISILSVIGFFYAFYGGSELFYILNEDQRQNHFYLTTFSNDIFGNIIRPSGIYDEPGALSFVICIIASIRQLLNKSKSGTWFLLLIGIFTFSLSHFIFILLFFIQDMKEWKLKNLLVLFLLLFIFFLIIFNSEIGVIFNDLIIKRLSIQDGKFSGDNRSGRIETCLKFLKDIKVFLFGLDVNCVVNPQACFEKNYDAFGDNPLGPLVLVGITLSLPYYIIIFYLLFKFIKKLNFIYLGLVLLLFQRPEVMSYGYSLLISIVIFLDILIARNLKFKIYD